MSLSLPCLKLLSFFWPCLSHCQPSSGTSESLSTLHACSTQCLGLVRDMKGGAGSQCPSGGGGNELHGEQRIGWGDANARGPLDVLPELWGACQRLMGAGRGVHQRPWCWMKPHGCLQQSWAHPTQNEASGTVQDKCSMAVLGYPAAAAVMSARRSGQDHDLVSCHGTAGPAW